MEPQQLSWRESKQQDLENQLTEFWSGDIWDIKKCPLNKKQYKSRVYQFIQFDCISKSLNIELKYACWQKLERKEWSIGTLWKKASDIENIADWLNSLQSRVSSLVEKNLESLELSLRSYLLQQGKLKVGTPSTRIDSSHQIRTYPRRTIQTSTLRQIYKILQDTYDDRPEYEKDIWDARKLGLFSNPSRSDYKLNFTKITQPWLQQATKKFIQYCLSTYSIGDCYNKISSLNSFSQFLEQHHSDLVASQINRSIIVEYLSYLASTKLTANVRARYISQLRAFLEMCSTEGWADVPEKRLIYSEDFPSAPKRQPRYIPEEVLRQLNHHLDELPPVIKRMVLILQECGMRIGELCRMPFNCLMQDTHGDWFLRYYQYKMKKEHSIPISREVAAVIQEQQQLIAQEYSKDFPFLFPTSQSSKKNLPMKQEIFAQALNKLVLEKEIRDANGCLWRFQSHQFRHTVGTRMINNGVPQHIIQRYLGHESPEMTARYAYIHDQTLKEEFFKFKGKVVDVMGRLVEPENIQVTNTDLQWIKKNILAQALPNGSCALPVVAGACPHANACLTCTHFRTTAEFLGEHKKQLDQTQKIIETAKANGWQRQVEMNQKIKENLEHIIVALEEDNHETPA